MNRKSVLIILGVVIGFALSYIPNNYMSENYENIALFFVIGIAIIGVLWGYISSEKQKTNR